MNLSKKNLPLLKDRTPIDLPGDSYFNLPEKVLQFGTGVLLRGLPDYFIDKANRSGIFNGRIVVVKSTSHGDSGIFDKQDGLYSLCIQGIQNGERIESVCVNAAVSRVLSANDDWDSILACASNPDMQIIISNTTEAGIRLQAHDAIDARPPASFPGKLLAIMHKRFIACNADPAQGFVVIPTELIPDNGSKLKDMLITLARQNNLGTSFIDWLQLANQFCSSLVDRIVPGAVKPAEKKIIEQRLGYEDDLMIMAEPYCLWAIESADEKVKECLSFHRVDDAVVIAPSISKFRELKLRLLNGTHSFSCGLAVLAGFNTVKAAMADPVFGSFVTSLIRDEIAPVITNEDISLREAENFAMQVIDRFRNPFIEHEWLNITLEYSSKMMMRNVPILQKYFRNRSDAPPLMILGFAGYLLFMKSDQDEIGQYNGHVDGRTYLIRDSKAESVHRKWIEADGTGVAITVLRDEDLWGADLSIFPGFSDAVSKQLETIMQQGVLKTMAEAVNNHSANT